MPLSGSYFMKKSIESIEGVMGDHLTIELTDFHKNDNESIKWAYSPCQDLNGEVPIDTYKTNPNGVSLAIENLYIRRDALRKLTRQNWLENNTP